MIKKLSGTRSYENKETTRRVVSLFELEGLSFYLVSVFAGRPAAFGPPAQGGFPAPFLTVVI
jgi:hypothetical protein